MASLLSGFTTTAAPASSAPASAPVKSAPSSSAPASSGLMKGFTPPTGKASQTSTQAQSAPSQPSYFAAVDAAGNSYGFSDQKDSSGIPYFAYRTPGATATTTDPSRVAFRVDPRTATTTTKAERATPRDNVGEAAQRVIQDAGPNDEIDHRMALGVGGSNDVLNMKKVPTSQNMNDSNLEGQLADEIDKGQISMFQAQIEEAENKGLPMPWTGQPDQKPSALDTFLKSAWDSIQKTGMVVYNKATQAIESPIAAMKASQAKQQAQTAGDALLNTVMPKSEDHLPSNPATATTTPVSLISSDPLPKPTDELAFLNTTAPTLTARADNLSTTSDNIDTMKTSVDSLGDQYDTLTASLQTQKSALDVLQKKIDLQDVAGGADPADVASFNSQANKYNATLAQLKTTATNYQATYSKYDMAVTNYNTSLDSYNSDAKNFQSRVDAYNGTSGTPFTPDTTTYTSGISETTPIYQTPTGYTFKQLFIDPTTIRPAFAREGDNSVLPYGGLSVQAAANLGSWFLEIIPKVTVQLMANMMPGQSVTLPFDASRIGFGAGQTVQSTGDRATTEFGNLNAENNPEGNPWKAVLNGIVATGKTTILDTLDAIGAEGVLTDAAGAVLDRTGPSTLQTSIKSLGLRSGDITMDSLQESFTNRFQAIVEEHGGSVDSGNFSIPKSAEAELNQLGQATNDVAKAMTGKGVPQLNTFGSFIQRVAEGLTTDMFNKSATGALPWWASGKGAEAPRGALPGTRPINPDIKPMGLSMQAVESVGFPSDEDVKGTVKDALDGVKNPPAPKVEGAVEDKGEQPETDSSRLIRATQTQTVTQEAPIKAIDINNNKAVQAFNGSTEQRAIATIAGKEVVIGSYGTNAIENKTAAGREDRLPAKKLRETFPHITHSFVAGNSAFRKGNIVHLAEMPDGEKRAIVTRENKAGQDEVINFFKVSKNLDTFKKNLANFGIPAQTRTGILSLERSASNPLTYRDTGSIADATEKASAADELTTTVLERLKGRTTVSKQFISDLTNSSDLKQPEKDLVRKTLEEFPNDVPIKDFTSAVKAQLLPLTRTSPSSYEIEEGMDATGGRYENIALPDNERGNVADYSEHIYQSPIKTSAGATHFSNAFHDDNGDEKDYTPHPRYFAHTRTEDMASEKNAKTLAEFRTGRSGMPDSMLPNLKEGGDTRRVIELQSDLFQKGRLEDDLRIKEKGLDYLKKSEQPENIPTFEKDISGLKKLEPYRNTWHERIIREEIKQAAKDGKTKLQFPTGETAMKIERLGSTSHWMNIEGSSAGANLRSEDLKVGKEITQRDLDNLENSDKWVITDVIGDGSFKAVPKSAYNNLFGSKDLANIEALDNQKETFDISGKMDANNPIYKFYEKEVARYLKRIAPDMQKVTDKQGVTWNEINVPKSAANEPIKAFKRTTQYKPLGRGPKIEISKVAALLKDFVPADKVKFVFSDSLIKDERALGYYKNNSRMRLFSPKLQDVIALQTKGDQTYVRTAFHESFHYLESLLSPEKLDEINKETLAKMTEGDHAVYDNKEYDTPIKRAAEYRADEFAKEQTSKAGYKSPIQKIIDFFKDMIDKIVDTAKKIKAHLDAIPNSQGGFIRNPLSDEEDEGLHQASKGEEPVVESKTGKDYDQEEKANNDLTKLLQNEELANIKNSPELDQLKTERISLAQSIENDPARALIKYTNKRTGELPEVLGGTGSIFGDRGDTIVTELGFKDSEEAREAVRTYKDKQIRLQELNKQTAELAKEVKGKYLEVADKVKLDQIIEKSDKHISELMGDEADKNARIKRLAKLNADIQARLQKEVEVRGKYEQAVREAKKTAIGKKRSLLSKLKEPRDAVAPLLGVDKESRAIYEQWKADVAVAHEDGRAFSIKMNPIRDQADMGTIDAYEAGQPNPLYRTHGDDMYTRTRHAGIYIGYWENHITHLYKEGPETIAKAVAKRMADQGVDKEQIELYINKEARLDDATALRLRVNPVYSYERTFPTYAEARDYGLTPRYDNGIDIMAFDIEHAGKVEANRKFVDSLLSSNKLLRAGDQPNSWIKVQLPNLTNGDYYGSPELAQLLKNKFPADPDKELPADRWLAKTVKMTGKIGRVTQDFVLMGLGVGNINFFGITRAIKDLTTLTGALPADVARSVLGWDVDFKSSKTQADILGRFLSTNFNAPTGKLFIDLQPTFREMAEQGINTANRIGGIDSATWGNIIEAFKDKRFKDAFGGLYAKSLEKTKDAYLPLQSALIFREAKAKGIASGLPEESAKQLAGLVVKNYADVLADYGGSNFTRDALNTLFMAIPSRMGAFGFFFHGIQGTYDLTKTGAGKIAEKVTDKKSGRQTTSDPRFYKNRQFIGGLLLTYALMNYVNKKNTGHYMFENGAADFFNMIVNIPQSIGQFLPGYKPGDTFKFPIGGSLTFGLRAIYGTAVDLATGDLKSARSQVIGLASEPLQILENIFVNQDYFGDPIYADTDSATVKGEKISSYLGLTFTPSFVKSTVEVIEGKEPLYQALYNAAFLPGKFSTLSKDIQSAIYNAIDTQKQNAANLKIQAQNEYETIHEVALTQGNAAAAALVADIAKTNPALANAINTVADNATHGSDGALLQLQVENGARAKQIANAVAALPTVQARNDYLNRLLSEKIITKKVQEELDPLIAQYMSK